MIVCALPECDAEVKPPRKRFCSEPHARRNRQRSEVAIDVEKEDLRAALRRSQKSLARAKAKTEDLVAAVYQAAKDASLAQPPLPRIQVPTFKPGKGHPEVALLHTTDWQYGKLTDTYNMAKCEERIVLLAEKVALLTHIQRAEHPVKRISVLLGGDMMEGLNIFPGQAWEVDGFLFAQMFGCVAIMRELFRNLLAQFEVVDVWEEWGNHGRIGRKGDWPRSDNTDRMVYEIVRQSFANEPRLIWHSHTSWYNMVEIGNYRAMLIHGDEIKSFGGNTPAFGILRKATAWSSGVVENFKDVYMGHFHTPMSLTLPNGGTVFATGSTESDNAYAAEFVAARGKPSQRLHYIDPRKGRVTCEYKVYLDDYETTREEASQPIDEHVPEDQQP